VLAAGTPPPAPPTCPVFQHMGHLSLDGATCALRSEVTASLLPTGSSSYTLEAEIKTTSSSNMGIISWGNFGTEKSCNALRTNLPDPAQPIAEHKTCKFKKWLGEHTTAQSCQAAVLADAGCSDEYFAYASSNLRGDNSCGCITPGEDCAKPENHDDQYTVGVYKIKEHKVGLVNSWSEADIEKTSSVNLADGSWHHVMATFDGTTRKLFVDNVEIGEDNPTGLVVTKTDNFCVGSSNNGEFFEGEMRSIKVWDAAHTKRNTLGCTQAPTGAPTQAPTAAPTVIANELKAIESASLTAPMQIKQYNEVINDGQCKVNGQWGHTGVDFGALDVAGCRAAIMQESNCNKKMFIVNEGTIDVQQKQAGKICTQAYPSPADFCNGEADCFIKGKAVCDADPACKGVMFAAVWAGGKMVQYCTDEALSSNKDWISVLKTTGCYCFSDLNADQSACTEFPDTGFKTYSTPLVDGDSLVVPNGNGNEGDGRADFDVLANSQMHQHHQGKRCVEGSASPADFCNGESDCFTKGNAVCEADPACKGVMFAAVWAGGKMVQYCTDGALSSNNDWISAVKDATVTVEAEIRTAGAHDDSFHVWFDEDTANKYAWHAGINTDFTWVTVSQTFQLSPGKHVLHFGNREDGAELRNVRLSGGATFWYVPPATAAPTAAPTGAPSVTPTAAPTGAPSATPTAAPTEAPTADL